MKNSKKNNEHDQYIKSNKNNTHRQPKVRRGRPPLHIHSPEMEEKYKYTFCLYSCPIVHTRACVSMQPCTPILLSYPFTI